MRVLVIFLLLVVAGCATNPKPEPSSSPLDPALWQARNAALLSQDEWIAHFSLIGANAQQKFKTRVIWAQTQEQYQIKLKDFIGRTVAIIDGSEDGVKVKTSKGQKFTGSNANELVKELFGIEIPVQGMRYWLRAIPLPDQEYELLASNGEGLVQHMSQSGWQLHYANYHHQDVAALPSNTILQFDELMLTIKVSRWEFPER